MNAIQKRIQELNLLHPDSSAPEDLDSFWIRTKDEAIQTEFASSRVDIHTSMQDMKLLSVTYEGFADTEIHAHLMLPRDASEQKPCPCLITFPGYTNDKGQPEQFAHWIARGVAVLSVDIRGQGVETGNRLGSSHGMVKGWITENLLDLERCYYKAVSVDILRAMAWLTRQPEIDIARIGAIGVSQGGGLALLLTALHEDISLVVADIPNMCHMDYGVFHSTGSLSEVAEFCRKFPDQLDHVLETLSYFDLLNLSDHLRVPMLVSVGLKDTVCLPEQIFPLYNSAASTDKKLEIYPFTGHAVEAAQQRKAIDFVCEHFLGIKSID
jgi:cephalosporin-C deacetylase